MYISNRKRAWKVVREYKTTNKVRLANADGFEFCTTRDHIAQSGYRQVKSRPAIFGRR